mmetsp:Transcript_77034/g.193766  ORF Transcript_77034/g.193766 Transcript_77034/m.193766 type:complete len:270 (+) Transcript_77034:570-1379(+)
MFLLPLRDLHFAVDVRKQPVNHGENSRTALLLVLIRGLRRRGQSSFVKLHEGEADAIVACIARMAVLLLLTLRRGLQQGLAVDFVQALLGMLDDLFGGSVAGHALLELCILGLALLRGLRDRLVQCPDALLQGRDLVCESGDSLLDFLDGRVDVRHTTLQRLLLVGGIIKLLGAILLLIVVIRLLLLQSRHETLDHLDDLIHADLLAIQRQRDEVEASVAVTRQDLRTDPLHQVPCLGAHRGSSCLELQEARAGARESFLEQLKGIVGI